MSGAWVSVTVTVKEQVALGITPFEAVTSTVVVPMGKTWGEVMTVAPILKVNVGAVQPTAVAEKLSLAVQSPGSVPVEILPWQTVMVGAILRDVTVGSAAPPNAGSSVSTFEKLVPVTVPWLLT